MRYVELPRAAPAGAALQESLAPAQIAKLCRRAFGPEGDVVDAEQLYSGRFNTTYRIRLGVGRQVILRLAPPASAHLFEHERWLLRRECAVHEVLAAAVAQVPRLLFQDFSGDLVSRDYVFLEHCRGRLWDELQGSFTPRENEALWGQLGALVRAIHCIQGAAYGLPHPMASVDCWSQAVLGDIDGLIGDLDRLGLKLAGARAFRALVVDNRQVLDHCGPPRLLHGDLWPKNILVDRVDGMPVITGLLDGERARWGDPGAEWIFGFLDIPTAFWSSYGRDLSDGALGHDAQCRRLIYNGRGALQLTLEAWRWGLDDGFARRLLVEAMTGVEAMLTRPLSIRRQLAEAA